MDTSYLTVDKLSDLFIDHAIKKTAQKSSKKLTESVSYSCEATISGIVKYTKADKTDLRLTTKTDIEIVGELDFGLSIPKPVPPAPSPKDGISGSLDIVGELKLAGLTLDIKEHFDF